MAEKTKRIAILGWVDSVHIQRWARGLKDRGYQVKVFSLGGMPLEDIEAVIFERSGRRSYLTQASRLVRAVEQFRPHLVHAHYATGFGYWMTRLGAYPRVLSVWGADVIDFPDSWLKKAALRWVLRSADHITATSQMLKRVTMNLAPELAARISVVPFGVTVPNSCDPPPPNEPFRLCFIKAHSAKYGPDILLKALAQVRRQIPNVRLTMAGTGEMTPALKEMTVALGLTETVDFVGFVDNRDMYTLLTEQHVMVMPSVMASESFGVAVLEAGACGRAVIASDIGGVPEVIDDGRTGILVPPNDIDALATAIARLAADRDLCVRMGREGHQFVRSNYNWDDSLSAMAGHYARLLASSH